MSETISDFYIISYSITSISVHCTYYMYQHACMHLDPAR